MGSDTADDDAGGNKPVCWSLVDVEGSRHRVTRQRKQSDFAIGDIVQITEYGPHDFVHCLGVIESIAGENITVQMRLPACLQTGTRLNVFLRRDQIVFAGHLEVAIEVKSFGQRDNFIDPA